MRQAFRESPHLNPPLPGVGQAYFNLSAPIALALGAMRKNLAAEVATLSGGGRVAYREPVSAELSADVEGAGAACADGAGGGASGAGGGGAE